MGPLHSDAGAFCISYRVMCGRDARFSTLGHREAEGTSLGDELLEAVLAARVTPQGLFYIVR